MSVDSDSDMYIKEVPKKKQKTLEDFVSAKPKPAKSAPKPAPAKKAPKPKALSSDDEGSDKGSSVAPPPKRTATSRAVASKKPTYVDISDDSDDGGRKNGDQSRDVFEMSDEDD